MATFPNYEPDDREYIPGTTQLDVERVRTGTEYRVKRSDAFVGDRIRLSYLDREPTVVQAFVDHYHGQGGGLIGFPLSSAAVLGYGSEALAAANAEWHWLEEPEIEAGAGGLQTVNVTLEALI